MTGNRVLVSLGALLMLLNSGALMASEGPAEHTVATISGRIAGYPSDWFPPMYVYAKNIDSRSTFAVYSGGSFDTGANIEYTITVCEPGTYVVFAWTDPEFSRVLVGAVFCAPADDGTLEPVPVHVSLGDEVTGIDIESGMFNVDQLMVPRP
ncbi:MAG: hypothetical protein JXA64_05965 [Candidatus Fermentibacteraceae bacterium]|nr:hypothetical protein [Candidatus Fermentibacteraceae bacterium]MBN2608642.1 hypothetical protein [Candidatus Fermentibacteraceae bacterium]